MSAGVLANSLGYRVDDFPNGDKYFRVGGFAHSDADLWLEARG